jgi:hypothetical protein
MWVEGVLVFKLSWVKQVKIEEHGLKTMPRVARVDGALAISIGAYV